MTSLVRDMRYGCRMLAKNPAFTCVSVVSLAIGIGANCAIFSFADALLLRPLNVPHASELLTVGSADPLEQSLVASYRDYLDVHDRATSFTGLTAFTDAAVRFSPEQDGVPTLRLGALVSGNFFDVIEVRPQLGRAFRPDEDQVPGRHAVVVLGHDFWQRQFGGDPSILGRTIILNGIAFTVVGVAPDGFTGLAQFSRFDFYAPLMMWPRLLGDPTVRPLDARGVRRLMIKGRLKSGVTLSQAQSELTVLGSDLERAYPDTNRDRRMVVRTELQNRVADAAPLAILLAMLGLISGAVLFVACANVAGLLASRAPVRAREIALRLAIGAGRPRIVQQLVVESLLIAAMGAALGLGVGYAGVMLFRRIRIPTDLPIVLAFELDRRGVLVSVVVALVSAILVGLIPAIRTTRADLTRLMKPSDGAGLRRRGHRGRALVVAGQVAVSVILLVTATHIYRGFQHIVSNGPGFRTDRLLMLSVDPNLLKYDNRHAQQFFERLVEQAELVPGVTSAALTRYMPLDGGMPSVTIVPEGVQLPVGKEGVTIGSSVVDEHFFDTIGLPILRGRGFRTTDSADAPPVAVVNEVVAERYWPGQDPMGKRFRLDNTRGSWVEIVGVAKTSRYSFLIEPPLEFVYLPFRQRPSQVMFLLVGYDGDPSSLMSPLREVVRRLDVNMPIMNVRTMQEHYRMRSVEILDVVTIAIGAMGLMGLALALVGLYGLVAYGVSRRTKEIGIRMAIGAERYAVVRLVLRQAMVLALAGLVVGLLASVGVSYGLAVVFPGGAYGDGRSDELAFILVAVAVMAVTLFAAYIPARRASYITPTEALRCE